jgi:aminoglycoside phosphotransferase (APT) family kinase protein
MTFIDIPGEIRKGEGLDTDTVSAYLKDSLSGLEGRMEIKQFPSGFSNLTYLLTIGQKELVLRKPPLGKKARTDHDMKREYNILKALEPVFPYVPKPLLYSDDTEIVGSPFYIMERMQGIILRKNFPKGMEIDKEGTRTLCVNLAKVLRELHALDYIECGLKDFGRPSGYIKRQIEGWSGRYRDSWTDDAPDFEKVMEWLKLNQLPDNKRPVIIHNDYKFDNVLLDPANPLNIIGVVDWEMSTIGDPLMDLGSSLAYWVNHDDSEEVKLIRTLPTTVPGMLTRKEFVSAYEEISGTKIENFEFYLCFGLFRLAVIAQQIYYRYYHGQTQDKRFRMLIFAVQILEKAALRVIETGTY